jgi:hypothetical protein
MKRAASPTGLWRLQAILGDERPTFISATSRFLLAGGIALDLGLASWPLFQNYLAYFLLCTCWA